MAETTQPGTARAERFPPRAGGRSSACSALGMMIAYFDRANLSVALALPDFKQQFPADRHRPRHAELGVLLDLRGAADPGRLVRGPLRREVPLRHRLPRSGAWCRRARRSPVRCAQLFALRVLLGVGESVVTPASMRWIRFNCRREPARPGGRPLHGGGQDRPGGRRAPRRLADRRLRTGGPCSSSSGSAAWSGWCPGCVLVRNDDQDLEQTAARQDGRAGRCPFRRIMASPVIWGTVIGTFCYQYFVYFCMTWMPAYFVERRGLSLQLDGAVHVRSASAAWRSWRRWPAGRPTA